MKFLISLNVLLIVVILLMGGKVLDLLFIYGFSIAVFAIMFGVSYLIANVGKKKESN